MRDIAKTAFILFLICVITTAALSVTNAITEDIIAKRAEEEAAQIRKQVFSAADIFEKMPETAWISENVIEAYKGISGDKFAGYVITTESKGYGGSIIIMTGISSDGKIVGVKVQSANETPGLGAKIIEVDFIEQFIGEIPKERFKAVKSKADSKEEIEAITGATISSRAVAEAVNTALDAFKEITQEGGDSNVE